MATRGQAISDDLIAQLSRLGDLRVWSVIITIFGDAVMPRGGVVSASTLSAITECYGIKPEALRVALFRLAKDGWIRRHKTGRKSSYSLTDSGRDEFLPASRRIYAAAPGLRAPWRLVGLPPVNEPGRAKFDAALRKVGFFALSPSLYLGGSIAGKTPPEAVVLESQAVDLPSWARAALAPEPLQQEYKDLSAILSRATTALAKSPDLPEPAAVALRVMVIHQWRRLLLRHADLPVEMMPAGWGGESCRAQVLQLHEHLSPLADTWLDTAVGPRS